MARLVGKRSTYQRIDSTLVHEKDYQHQILAHSGNLFPGLEAVAFETPVNLDGRIKKPDMALVEPNLMRWWVVEVELAHHSFNSHVLPQIEVFAQADYREEHAEALVNALPHLDAHGIRQMVLFEPPSIQVIVDGPVPRWESDLERLGARIMTVELFRPDGDQPREPLFLVSGQEPLLPADLVCECIVDQTVPRMLKLDRNLPSGLPQQVIKVLWRGSLTEWILIESSGTSWLKPSETHSWSPGTRLQLMSIAGKALEFRERKH